MPAPRATRSNQTIRKNIRSASFLLACVLTVAWVPAAQAGGITSKVDNFNRSIPVPNSELAKMRGGFITLGGLTLEFGLQTRTVIDGVTEADIFISTNNLQNIDTNALQRVIQVGANNNAAALNELMSNPSLLTVIQNSDDNKLIQNFNVLSLDVQNLQAFQNQQMTSAIELGNIQSIQ